MKERVSRILSLRKSRTPKELRDHLFGKEKPVVRRLEILDGDQYSKDMGILWAAYRAGSFSIEENLTQEDFVNIMEIHFSKFNQVWVVDDANPSFSQKMGPVGIVLTNVDRLLIEARFGFFKWASSRNIFRAAAAFLNMVKHSTRTGVCMVKAEKGKRVLPEHLKNYDLLYYVGKVSEFEYLYSIRGRGSN